MLNVNAKRVCQALHNNDETQFVTLDVSNAFDRVSQVSLLHKLNGYDISG